MGCIIARYDAVDPWKPSTSIVETKDAYPYFLIRLALPRVVHARVEGLRAPLMAHI